MKILNQDLWTSKADLIVVTCNGIVTKHGKLVMGRGAAMEAANRYPELPTDAGRLIKDLSSGLADYVSDMGNNTFLYGFLPVIAGAGSIGLFQVKFHFRDAAKFSLIGFSLVRMNEWLRKFPKDAKIAMNFPGIGFGGLQQEDVEPILEDLDDRVTLYIK